MKDVRIPTDRFLLRSLLPEDVTECYSAWLDDEAARNFIDAARRVHDTDTLKRFVAGQSERADALMLGIFEISGERHIGNLKYEPLDREQGYAVMGILVGEPDWRGKGVATEVIAAADLWLFTELGMNEIALNVHRDNAGAIRAYEKVGYRKKAVRWFKIDSDHMSMVHPRPG